MYGNICQEMGKVENGIENGEAEMPATVGAIAALGCHGNEQHRDCKKDQHPPKDPAENLVGLLALDHNCAAVKERHQPELGVKKDPQQEATPKADDLERAIGFHETTPAKLCN